MIKKVIYRDEDGNRRTMRFDVGGKRMATEIRTDKQKEADSIKFIKTVDYLASVYIDK